MPDAPALPRSTANPWLGRGLCVVTAVLWSTSGVFIKTLTAADGSGWSGFQVAGVRSLVAGVTLLALARPRRLLPTGRQLVLALITAPMLLTYVLAQTYTTTANAILLQYTAPAYVMVLAPLLLRERPRLADVLTLPALIAGILLILSADIHLAGSHFGNAMGLTSGVGYALVVMLMRKWRDAGAVMGLAWGNLLLAAVAIPWTGFSDRGLVAPTAVRLAQILWLGVFQIGLAYFLFQACLRHIAALEASLLSLVEPVLCPLWAWWVVGDRPPATAIGGGAIILTALALHTAWAARRERRSRRAPMTGEVAPAD